MPQTVVRTLNKTNKIIIKCLKLFLLNLFIKMLRKGIVRNRSVYEVIYQYLPNIGGNRYLINEKELLNISGLKCKKNRFAALYMV